MDLEGILLIDKEEGRTSFETVRMVKKKLQVQKAGHAGTLDKSASGLLIICINRATAIQNLIMGNFKEYNAKVCFGIETDTLDSYGSIVKTGMVADFTENEIRNVLKSFTGRIMQTPPYYSALHKEGKRLYRRALNGELLDIEPREVEIRDITLLEKSRSWITIEVVASKGSYIRSLARDIALSLGTCGYLGKLKRISVGSFSIADAYRLDEISSETPLIPMHAALPDLPKLEVDREVVPQIYNGAPAWKILKRGSESLPSEGYICLMHGNRLVAIVKMGKRPVYFKVFRPIDRSVEA